MDTQEKPTEKAFYLQCAECTQKHLANAIAYAADVLPRSYLPIKADPEKDAKPDLDESVAEYWEALLNLSRAKINLAETALGYNHLPFAVGLLGRAQSLMPAAKVPGHYIDTVRKLRQRLGVNGTEGLEDGLRELEAVIVELSDETRLPGELVYCFANAYAEYAEAVREMPEDLAVLPVFNMPYVCRVLRFEGVFRVTLSNAASSQQSMDTVVRRAGMWETFRSEARDLIEHSLTLYHEATELRKMFDAKGQPETLQEGGDNHDDQD